MSKCEVFRATEQGDWVFDCPRHNETVWCDSWLGAMEAFWGHTFMHHATIALAEERQRLRELAKRFHG